ncbi:MAG: 2-hydroxychromene-2-carboxylate isomerase [Gammaproteobacteria bacterium]
MKNLKKIDFYFDCSSPWTYLAFREIIAISERKNLSIVWYPILVGGVFNAVNQDVYEIRKNPNPLKAKYAVSDLQLWAQVRNLKINWPKVFPVNSVNAMRGCIYAKSQGKVPAFAEEVFSAYWTHQVDISSIESILELGEKIGFNLSDFQSYITSEKAKVALKKNTQALIERGGFGSPTYFYEDKMFFGNDRMDLLEKLIDLTY